MIKLTLEEFKKKNREEYSGKVLAFSTDTVWGVGVLIDHNIKMGLDKIYKMKKRDLQKPLAVLAPNVDSFIEHIYVNDKIKDLFSYWPGALTLIFKKNDDYFNEVTLLDTIGIRIPNSMVTLEILNHLGLVTTTSVNISTEEPLNDPKLIEEYFSDFLDYLIIDESSQSKTSSTIIDVSNHSFKILRQGEIKINV